MRLWRSGCSRARRKVSIASAVLISFKAIPLTGRYLPLTHHQSVDIDQDDAREEARDLLASIVDLNEGAEDRKVRRDFSLAPYVLIRTARA